jgi:2-polyprenyl-3-methyl-5-hydroxy-6-metoxy-1,4-benzoquinol methylase
MNFIRFVKTPRIGQLPTKKSTAKGNTKKPSSQQLSMILTITTDFSPFAGSVEVLCQLVSPNNCTQAEKRVQWTEAHRELKVDFLVPSTFREGHVVVTPLPSKNSRQTDFLSEFFGGSISHVVGVQTGQFSVNDGTRHDTVYRQFTTPAGPLRIAEQAGETIIQHVWDAGIILSAALSRPIPFSLPDELYNFIHPLLQQRTMKLLELGTGVGILGICIAATHPNAKVIMTDLSDAQPLVDENIHLNVIHHPRIKHSTSFRELDWEYRPFPDWTKTETFDLIVMADVTYNTATFNALADTLEHLLRHGARGAKVLCCGKRRHDAEEQFWRTVRERGFTVEKRVIFAVDLEGNIRYCGDGVKIEGEQLVDFTVMSIA